MSVETIPKIGAEAEHSRLVDALSPYEIADIVLTPAVHSIMKDTHDVLLIDKDPSAISVQIGGWLHYKLRERSGDGPSWEQTRLTPWSYRHPDDTVAGGFQIEESTYWLDPRYPLTEVFSETEAAFITNPFEHLPYDHPTEDALTKWLDTWKRVTQHPESIYPGQYMRRHIPGLRYHVLEKSKELLKEKGYTHITAVPTWFHTAAMYEHLGFSFVHEQDQRQVEALRKRFVADLKVTRAFSSWVVMRQFWAKLVEQQGYSPESMVDDTFILRDEHGTLLTFPLTPERNLWMEQSL